MSGTGPAVFHPSIMEPVLPERQEIDSRFGRITVHPAQAVLFPTGLLGMPKRAQFCLARFPSEKMQRFSILQSLTDTSLAFITLPLEISNPIIDQDDLAQAAHDLDLPLNDLLLLLIVTIHREAGGTKLSVNARAPVLIRPSLKVGAQYVFPHTKYLIRQPLTL